MQKEGVAFVGPVGMNPPSAEDRALPIFFRKKTRGTLHPQVKSLSLWFYPHIKLIFERNRLLQSARLTAKNENLSFEREKNRNGFLRYRDV